MKIKQSLEDLNSRLAILETVRANSEMALYAAAKRREELYRHLKAGLGTVLSVGAFIWAIRLCLLHPQQVMGLFVGILMTAFCVGFIALAYIIWYESI